MSEAPRGNVRKDETPALERFVLDGLFFVPMSGDREFAFFADGDFIGVVGIDDVTNDWRVRKGDGDWRHARCRAEARAFLVSKRNN